MNFLEPIVPVAAPMVADPIAAAAPSSAPAASFATWFADELSSVSDKLGGTERTLNQVALGDSGSLHKMMIDMEEARLSFQLLAQVRNRLLDAYQEVMRMQV